MLGAGVRSVGAAVVVTGTVTDDGGRPLDGATVFVEGEGRGTSTRDGGRYSIALPAATASRGRELAVTARMIGYRPATRRVAVAGDTVRVDFALVVSPLMLSELVVTGAGTGSPPVRAGRVARKTRAAAAAAAGVVAACAACSGGAPPRAAGLACCAASPAPAVQYVDAASAASGAAGRADTTAALRRAHEPFNTESYDRIYENPWLAPRATPLSTFSIDVDRASYGNVRRFIDGEGRLPPADAVRIEELINYFPYDYGAPDGDAPFSVAADVAPAPWNREHRLVRIGLQGRKVDAAALPPSNLVFLIDVSGSMQSPDKLPLVKQALRLLVDQLREQDRVAIVVYAGSAGLVLPPTPGSDKTRIMAAIDALEAGGSTAGGAGIRLAYDVARASRRERGNNRVILATDGDFNVGVSSDAELTRLVEQRREEGTFLTVLGFGTGNLKDSRMEKLADQGNGNYAYVDDILEARKVLVHEMGGTLLTIAKDVKLQVEFNPARVEAYRLIGYENRLLRDQDFNDDAKDAGDLGAGHSVTALYEVVPVGSRSPVAVRGVDRLRYQRPAATATPPGGSELLYVKLRYKEPDGARSRLLQQGVVDRGAPADDDLTFAAAVAELGLVLRGSEYRGSATIEDAIALAERSRGRDPGGYRADFVRLARKAQALRAGEVVAAGKR
ncbi:MAG: von Willebrand factor type A domain-containing protein [Gemmatimonadaceae bacterium]